MEKYFGLNILGPYLSHAQFCFSFKFLTLKKKATKNIKYLQIKQNTTKCLS